MELDMVCARKERNKDDFKLFDVELSVTDVEKGFE